MVKEFSREGEDAGMIPPPPTPAYVISLCLVSDIVAVFVHWVCLGVGVGEQKVYINNV